MQKKNYKQDNKTIKEKTRRELSIKIAELASKHLTQKEQEILGEVLVDDKTFKEIGDKLQLTGARVRQIFEKGVRRMYYFIVTIDEKVHKYPELLEKCYKLEQEITDLRKGMTEVNKEEDVQPALSPEVQRLLRIRIEDTSLSVRIKNLCANGDIYGNRPETIEDLIKLGPEKLKAFRNCGNKSIDEIRDFLLDNGLKWGMLDSSGVD
jgi:hypothetical protein